MAAKPAPAPPEPQKCSNPACDATRHIEVADGLLVRCPACHWLSPTTLPALLRRRDGLQAELAEVDQLIVAAEASEWARGPEPA